MRKQFEQGSEFKMRRLFGAIQQEESTGKSSGSLLEEHQSMQKQMKRMVQVRKIPQGKYFQRTTSQYELILEYQRNTLHISLYTVREKNYELIVLDEGTNKLSNGLLSLDIFQAFRESPQICAVNYQEGILILETKYSIGKREKIERKEIKMEETELSEERKIRVEYSRKGRKCLEQKKKEDAQKINEYERKVRQYFNQMQDFFVEVSQNASKACLVDKTTPYAQNFTLQSNRIILQNQRDGGLYQQIMLKIAIRKYPFTFTVRVNTAKFVVGVFVRHAQAQAQSSELSGNAVCFDNQTCTIHYGEKGEHKKKVIFNKKDPIIKVKVIVKQGQVLFHFTTRRKIKVQTSTYHKQDVDVDIENREIVQSDIVNQVNLGGLVPFFQLAESGSKLQWSID